MSSAPDESVLRKQYEHVLQEYRFQVQLNWDRSKHYLTFNTAVLGAAVALASSADTWSTQAGRVALFVICAANSLVGRQATAVGHRYYQRIRRTKSELEKALGLEAYAIQSTPGMMRDHDSIARGTPPASEQRFASIVAQTRALLGLLFVLSVAGAVLAALQIGEPLRAAERVLVPRERLLEALEEAASEGRKALVFSQWTSLLDKVEPHLRAANIAFTRLDGSRRDRGSVVTQFQSESRPPVMLDV